MQPHPSPLVLAVSSWKTFKSYWKPLVFITIIPSLALYISQALISVGSIPLGLIGSLLALAGAVASIALQPTLVIAVNKISTQPGAVISFREQYQAGFRYFWPVLGLVLLQGLIVTGSTLLFIVPMIIVEVYTCLYIYNRILDDKKGLSAFTENYSLVKGRWWATLGQLLFLVAVYAVSSVVIFGVLFLIGKAAGFSLNSPGAEAFSGALNLLLNAVMMPLGVIYLYNLFVSLKATRMPDVQTDKFKKWLVFFIVLGAVALVLLPVLGLSVATFLSAHPHP